MLPHIIKRIPISGAPTVYTDANKSRKRKYNLENVSKVAESPYKSVQKSELYAIIMVWSDFQESLKYSDQLSICKKGCFIHRDCWTYSGWFWIDFTIYSATRNDQK